LTHSGARPDLEGTDFVAPNATVLGNVTVGINSSIWYGATIIGTKNISIGDNCVIQDRCHLSREIKIGNNVFVGPNSIIQGS
jgi:carbonic anhydrase/acetyltransferase-like protein (isoleucine patch superfamily)